MKCTARMYAYHVKYEWQGPNDPAKGMLLDTDSCGDAEHALVGPVVVEYEIPDDFDPRPAKIKALQEQAEKLRATFAKSITDINSKIAELTAIEYVQEK
jgi:hypothetical protein